MTKSGKLCDKEKLSNFYICHNVFKSRLLQRHLESICMRERVKLDYKVQNDFNPRTTNRQQMTIENDLALKKAFY